MPSLVPYKAEHLLMFVDRDGIYYDIKSAISKEQGVAFTALVGERVIACAGVSLQWPGLGTAWTVFSKDAEPYMLWCTRYVKRILRDAIQIHKLHRIELTVLEGFYRNEQWALFLGFDYEDGTRRVTRFYTATKENVIRMEMLP